MDHFPHHLLYATIELGLHPLDLEAGAHQPQGELVRHLGGKATERLESGAVHRRHHHRPPALHRLDGLLNLLIPGASQVKTAQHRPDLFHPADSAGVLDRVDNARVGAARDDQQPFAAQVDDDGLVVFDVVGQELLALTIEPRTRPGRSASKLVRGTAPVVQQPGAS